jgi:glycosyltransferase involved in cell wall biosynthesis
LVKKCLDSLAVQTNNCFQVILVDYGSSKMYADELILLSKKYSFIELMQCPVQGQLWNKSRAINIAVRHCDTDYVLVSDIDMIFSPKFIDIVFNFKLESEIAYFQVGYLSKEESKLNKEFSTYVIKHKSTIHATGITLFPKNVLAKVNGYDEFYHGWGSEDTDVHNRINKLGVPIHFYDSEVLLLHQWHEKSYRSLLSDFPFHTQLERINQKYLESSKLNSSITANKGVEWGKPFLGKGYQKLDYSDHKITISNEKNEFKAFILGGVFQLNSCIEITVERHEKVNDLKNVIKRKVGKKSLAFFDLEESNNLLLEMVIVHFRNLPYRYKYDLNRQEIILTINLNP